MGFFQMRRMRKHAKETLRHCRHVHNLRADLLGARDLAALEECQRSLRDALRSRDAAALEAAIDAGMGCAGRLMPQRPSPALRENVEVIAVAVAVAMGFRTYILQPFKIPTGSMQPTLYGIHVENGSAAGITDRLPLKACKWIVTGEWHMEIRARAGGPVVYDERESLASGGTEYVFYIDGKRHRFPRSAALLFQPGQSVEKGDLLWAGTRYAGDHVFVDKIRWNFRRPHRGEITVFDTRKIAGLPAKTHYIKRMSGLPGETISIDPPYLKVNGDVVLEPKSIRRIAKREGYGGYRLVEPSATDPSGAHMLRSPKDEIHLGPREYFVLGDNTGNSRDGRYWGHVPAENLVGPAALVYWPFSARWGLCD